jgi:hypothetical protein
VPNTWTVTIGDGSGSWAYKDGQMNDWLTWENGLFALALFIAVSSLIGMMKTLHDAMVSDISQKIEATKKLRLIKEAQLEQEEAREEQIRRREEQLERIRNNPAA